MCPRSSPHTQTLFSYANWNIFGSIVSLPQTAATPTLSRATYSFNISFNLYGPPLSRSDNARKTPLFLSLFFSLWLKEDAF